MSAVNEIKCPSCRAEKGEPCTHPVTGRAMYRVHHTRLSEAAALKKGNAAAEVLEDTFRMHRFAFDRMPATYHLMPGCYIDGQRVFKLLMMRGGRPFIAANHDLTARFGNTAITQGEPGCIVAQWSREQCGIVANNILTAVDLCEMVLGEQYDGIIS